MDILTSLFPIFIIFLIFYFIVIRPQTRAEARKREFIKKLKKGDVILLSSGIVGKVHEVEDRTLIVEISKDVKVKVLKDVVQGPYSEPQPQQKVGHTKDAQGKKEREETVGREGEKEREKEREKEKEKK